MESVQVSSVGCAHVARRGSATRHLKGPRERSMARACSTGLAAPEETSACGRDIADKFNNEQGHACGSAHADEVKGSISSFCNSIGRVFHFGVPPFIPCYRPVAIDELPALNAVVISSVCATNPMGVKRHAITRWQIQEWDSQGCPAHLGRHGHVLTDRRRLHRRRVVIC